MKKRYKYAVTTLIALLLALTLGGCTISKLKVEEREKHASFYANMYAYNYITQCGEEVFYIQTENDAMSLHVRTVGGTDSTLIAENIARYFVTDNYIFFETNEGDGLYRTDHTGKHVTQVSEEMPAELVAMGTSVFFTTYETENPKSVGNLYKAAADGTNAVLIANTSRVYNLFPYNEVLYFCIAEVEDSGTEDIIDFGNGWVGVASDDVYPMNGSIYTYDPVVEDTMPKLISGAKHVKRFLIADGQIFWVGLQLWRMDLDGEESVICGDSYMLVDGCVLNLYKNALYYGVNYNRVDRYDLSANTVSTALEQPTSAIWVAEDTVYCVNSQSGAVATLS